MHISEAMYPDEKRWNDFVALSEQRSFLQTWAWGEMQDALRVPYWRVVVENKGKMVAVALVLQRNIRLGYSWLYVPRGPIIVDGLSREDREHVWELLEEKFESLARECGAFFVRIDPLFADIPDVQLQYGIPIAWRKAAREVQPRQTALLDIRIPEGELLASMHSKTRYNIRLAERKGVVVEYSCAGVAIDKFLTASRAVSQRNGFSYHPDEYYKKFLEVLGRADMAEVAIARVGDEVLAVHIMAYADGIATYVHGASVQEKRSYMAPTLLYWETMKRAQEKGMYQYDFFGVAPGDAGLDHPWAGITRIKMGFGGTRASYIGAYDLVINEAYYAGFGVMRDAARIIKNTIPFSFTSGKGA